MTCEHDASLEAEKDRGGEDAELGRVLEAYLADLEAGRPDDRERLMAAHPAIAQQLRACLRVLNLADRMVDSSDAGAATRRPSPRLDSTTSPQGQSALATIGSGAPLHVRLRDLPDESESVIKPRSAEMPVHNGASLGRYQLQGEIARGGMGAILKGRDVDLGRDLALKVLLEAHQGNPEVVSRFIEEAQIGGQLQHPGIAPVYELGTFPEPDRRPYIAMKLVKGQTLAAFLQERPDPAHDLPRLLTIFEQICQTVSYAHARGVIHRDLKPSNVMVGSFGEVQVMDWGLAKVLPRGGIADEAEPQPAHESAIMTVRSGSEGSGSDSQAGSVLGTPAFMAPEQARGEPDRIDERADVFGLGAILCEILTGQPPFTGSTRDEIRAQAARGDTADIQRRLDASGADADLVGLARDCVAAERDRRPRNAGELARRLTLYLASVQERLRSAELARVEALARAAEELKRSRLAVGLAASVLGLIVLGVSGAAYWVRQAATRRTVTERLITAALTEATLLCDQAAKKPGDEATWEAARRVIETAQQGLQTSGQPAAADRLTTVRSRFQSGLKSARRDRALLDAVVEIRTSKQDLGADGVDAAYSRAFLQAGLDIDGDAAAQVGAELRSRSLGTAAPAALDDWALARRQMLKHGPQAWRRPLEVALVADADADRNGLRSALLDPDATARKRALLAIAASPKAAELPPATAVLLAASLSDSGAPEQASKVLRAVANLHPQDLWANYDLAEILLRVRPAARDDALRYFTVARAIRPESAFELARLLDSMGRSEEALDILADLTDRRPGDARNLAYRSVLLTARGRSDEARVVLGRAVAAGLAATLVAPEPALVQSYLGNALQSQGKLDEAAAAYRAAISLRPEFAAAHIGLGNILRDQGKLGQAVAEYREAIRLAPDAMAHDNLGNALLNQGHLDEAVAEHREAIRLEPHSASAHNNLGGDLATARAIDEAMGEFREAVRLKPDFATAHYNIGKCLRVKGQIDEAIREYRIAIELKPDYAEAHTNLGLALYAQNRPDEASAEYGEALRHKPDLPEAHYNLAIVLRAAGDLTRAIAEFRKAHQFGKRIPKLSEEIQRELTRTQQQVSLLARLPAVLVGKLKPTSVTEMIEFAQLCYEKTLHAASARLWSEAFQADPKLAEDMQSQHRYNAACAAALAGSGQSKDDPPLDEAAKNRWRKQSIAWLKSDLMAWSKLAESAPPQVSQSIAQTLQHWKTDPDLASLRDPTALAKLPKEEQKSCQSLWSDVDALLAEIAPKPTP
jgi:serine/threonine-protein kinase